MKKTSGIFKVFFILYVFLVIPFSAFAGDIRDTKHNLSVSADNKIKAVSEPGICIFCHTPHNANPAYPLWNHEQSAVQTYTVYWSGTLQSYSQTESHAWKVDGSSKLCLSCHDGTVAVGSVQSRWYEILMASSDCLDSTGRLIDGVGCSGYIGTDLSGSHPISIVYDSALVSKRNNANITSLCWLNPPPTGDPDVKLSRTQGGHLGVQCTSCHNPHTNKSLETKNGQLWPPFWQKTSYNNVCYVCHHEDCGEPSVIWP